MNVITPIKLTACEAFFLTQLAADNQLLMADRVSVSSLLRQGFVELRDLGWVITNSGREALRLDALTPPRTRRSAPGSAASKGQTDGQVDVAGMTLWVAAASEAALEEPTASATRSV